MKTPADPRALLHEIAAIERMERGKLSIIRQGPEGPYYNLQRREEGRNVTEYVPRDQVPLLEEHIAAYGQFERLVGEYERLITEATRRERRAGLKKKRPIRTSPSPKKPRSKH
ncbi:MAG TPA: DUF6788 family protein [Verrucomicrobiales bacterium]|nr:DUF6788 family protein [Verrucomicrobiales bacterium]